MDERPFVPAPVGETERITGLDVVRGLAVLGILAMNIVEFGLPRMAYENPAYAGGQEGADLWSWYAQTVFFNGKMRALFSMLFGAGMVLLWQRLEQKGQGARAPDVLLRRCLWLIVFGIGHRFLLLWTGDILYMYGLLGLIAVPFRLLRARWLFLLGLAVLSVFVLMAFQSHDRAVEQRTAWQEAEAAAEAGADLSDEQQQARQRWERRMSRIPPKPEALQKEIEARRGDWSEVSDHLWNYNHKFQTAYLYYYFVWDVLGMLLLGMGLMKIGLFAGTCPRSVYVGLIAAGLLAMGGVFAWARAWAGTGFSAAEPEIKLAHDLSYPFERGIIGLAHASVLLLLVRAGRARWLTAPLAAVGRMAFSNYILQSVLCTLLFHGYGFGLFGELSRSELMLVLAAVSLVQVVWSVLWLRVFRFGPLEWTWRCLTYWRLQPLRRR